MTPPLALRSVTHAWAGQPVLQGIDLELEPGELVALVGPSGCGKTTLLRIAAGLTVPSGGQVLRGGERVGLVFQHPNLLPWRTALANVHLPLELEGRPDRERAREALRRVELAHAEDLLPRALSGGMQMRVALARALVTRPGLLLMDEPFAALDALTRRRLQAWFLELAAEAGFAALLVTHDVDEAIWLCDRVIVLGGRPATIRGRHAVPLPRPRTEAMRHDARLAALAERIESEL